MPVYAGADTSDCCVAIATQQLDQHLVALYTYWRFRSFVNKLKTYKTYNRDIRLSRLVFSIANIVLPSYNAEF